MDGGFIMNRRQDKADNPVSKKWQRTPIARGLQIEGPNFLHCGAHKLRITLCQIFQVELNSVNFRNNFTCLTSSNLFSRRSFVNFRIIEKFTANELSSSGGKATMIVYVKVYETGKTVNHLIIETNDLPYFLC